MQGYTDRQFRDLIKRSKKKFYTHLSHTPLKKLEVSYQEFITGFNAGGRPEGIWFSNGSSWLDFLIQNEGKLKEQFKPCCYFYDIVLGDKILKVNTAAKLAKLNKDFKNYWHNGTKLIRGRKYIHDLPFTQEGRAMGVKRDFNALERRGAVVTSAQDLKEDIKDQFGINAKKNFIEFYKFIRWDLVAKKYNGVEFIPYFRNYRKKWFWYWSLDAPSGCIWNPKGIKSIHLMAVKKDGLWYLSDYGREILKVY